MASSRTHLALLGSGFGAFSLLKTIMRGLYDVIFDWLKTFLFGRDMSRF